MLPDANTPPPRSAYAYFTTIDTRWADEDAYGHVNNVAYYGFFDTAVNRRLIERGVLDPRTSRAIGLVVESGCRYFESLSFPDRIEAGLKVERLGTSSVTYDIALFRNDSPAAAARGRFVHVYVDRETRRPTPIPDDVRAVLAELLGG
jgi:acyl-CoA thioester hydrolase